ncbi:MAG: hypothetical protein LIR40_08215 [Bacteroidota bacterium]|nr:hypothetical protein [Bacteroidota bacterium]
MNMNTTHFVIMNQMHTTNMVNQMNLLHMMNHHNTTNTVTDLTGLDMVVIIVGFILLLWGGVKLMEWLLDKTYPMKDLWGSIVCIIGMFSYVFVGVVIISFFMCLV